MMGGTSVHGTARNWRYPAGQAGRAGESVVPARMAVAVFLRRGWRWRLLHEPERLDTGSVQALRGLCSSMRRTPQWERPADREALSRYSGLNDLGEQLVALLDERALPLVRRSHRPRPLAVFDGELLQ